MRFHRIAVSALVLALALVCSTRAQGLKVGDPAPKLEVKEFLKGEPVARLEKGQIYVIDFWGSWCVPCKTSIPRLTDLQKKYPGAIVIGISALEREAKAIKPFVQDMGDKMAYRVAVDSGLGATGKMALSWLKAANQKLLPVSFIVNKDTRIAWIGHPLEMERALKEVVADTYDLEAAVAEAKKKVQLQARIEELDRKLQLPPRAGNPKEVLQTAQQLDELTEGKHMVIVHLLAKAYFNNGDAAKAVETEERVVKLAKGTKSENNPQIMEALEKYKKAAEKKK